MQYFDPQPSQADLPKTFPSPFASRPHAIAERAALRLQQRLSEFGIADHDFAASGGGKMFGVLVVRDDSGGLGFLSGFSGMIRGRWIIEGFVPPIFDLAVRDEFWLREEAGLDSLTRRIEELEASPELVELMRRQGEMQRRHKEFLETLRRDHRGKREERRRLRQSLAGDLRAKARLQELESESRNDRAERRSRSREFQVLESALDQELVARQSNIAELAMQRSKCSAVLMRQIHDLYRLTSHSGESRTLRSFFGDSEPPGGAGDCAAPKLIEHANRHGLLPLALAEFWWGAPPKSGGRRTGMFYPACRGKCGPLLPHLLAGLAVEEEPLFGSAGEIDASEPRIVFEDDWLVVVDKPAFLLSVPGRSPRLQDSVQSRMRRQFPEAGLAHRLDLDTSGLLLLGKNAEACARLQKLFQRRRISKRYVALVDGVVAEDRGRIDLALRVDLDDRPRQIHDPVHGKAAVTDWKVLERLGNRTRICFHPKTGRTHQLRVHAAHSLGLSTPIVGDRLYGLEEKRLLLHAAGLAFTHPFSGRRVEVKSAVPF